MKAQTEKTYELIVGVFKHATEKAILFHCSELDKSIWIPKSVIKPESLAELGVDEINTEVSIEIATWFCDKNNLE